MELDLESSGSAVPEASLEERNCASDQSTDFFVWLSIQILWNLSNKPCIYIGRRRSMTRASRGFDLPGTRFARRRELPHDGKHFCGDDGYEWTSNKEFSNESVIEDVSSPPPRKHTH